MDRQQRGEQLFNRLVRHGSSVPASVFPQSSTWSWLKDPVRVSRAAGLTRTGLGMLGIDPISYGLEKLGGLGLRALGKLPYLSLNTLLPEEVAATTLGSRAALASGLAGGLLAGAGAFMGIWGGLAEVGKAKLEGQKIAQGRLAISAYVNKYAETLAGHAQAIDESSAYQPQVTAGLSAWLKPWEQRAIADAHAALKALGEQDGRAVLQYLQDSYGGAPAMTRALRQEVMNHSLKHVSPQLRRSLNLTGELGGGAQTRTGLPQPKVEQGIQVDEHTVYWPQRKHTDFTKPFVIETQIPRQRPFTRIDTPFVIETRNPHRPSGGSSRPSLFQQLNQQLQRLDAGPSSSFKPVRLFDAGSRTRLGLSNLTFGGFGGSFSIVPSLSRPGRGSLSDLWDSGSSFDSLASRPPGSSSTFQPARLFDAGSRARLGLSDLTFGGFGGSFSTVPSLSRSGGGPLSNLWNASSSFSSASTGPSSIRLSTSPSLTSGNWGSPFNLGANPLAWQGAGGLSGGPSLRSFARGL